MSGVGGLKEGGGGHMNFHVASSVCVCVGGSSLTLASQHGGGGHVLIVPIKSLKNKNSRSLGFYKLNSYQAN